MTHNKRFETDSLRRRFAPPPLAAQAFRWWVLGDTHARVLFLL